jgi:hypothetical protein
MLSALLVLGLGVAVAGRAPTSTSDRKAVEHVLEVSGLPRDRALLITHNQKRSDYVTVIRKDGKHSLAGWYPVTRHSLSSPRVMVVPAKELDQWLTQVETVVTTFDVKEREWLRAAPTARGAQPRLEVELPDERVDCGEGLRIQRRAPKYWPDVYVEQVKVLEATDTTCSIQRTPPKLPSRLTGLGVPKLVVVSSSLIVGLGLLAASLWRAIRNKRRAASKRKVKSKKRPGPRARS